MMMVRSKRNFPSPFLYWAHRLIECIASCMVEPLCFVRSIVGMTKSSPMSQTLQRQCSLSKANPLFRTMLVQGPTMHLCMYPYSRLHSRRVRVIARRPRSEWDPSWRLDVVHDFRSLCSCPYASKIDKLDEKQYLRHYLPQLFAIEWIPTTEMSPQGSDWHGLVQHISLSKHTSTTIIPPPCNWYSGHSKLRRTLSRVTVAGCSGRIWQRDHDGLCTRGGLGGNALRSATTTGSSGHLRTPSPVPPGVIGRLERPSVIGRRRAHRGLSLGRCDHPPRLARHSPLHPPRPLTAVFSSVSGATHSCIRASSAC